jgi:adenylate kinase family enzyme
MTQVHPFRQARRAACPIIGINTADPTATIAACAATRNGKADAFLSWDSVAGLQGLDKDGIAIAATIGEPADTQNLVQCLALIADKKPARCSVFIHNAHNAFADSSAKQAIWNLRDTLPAVGSCLVLLGPALTLPPELANDMQVLDEPTPATEDIQACIDDAINDIKKSVPELPEIVAEEKSRIVDCLTGYLSVFAIKQSLALASTKTGIDPRRLWELKVASLRGTAGLDISQPTVGFQDLAGTFGAKDFFGKLINGRQRVRGVFFLDEIEKMLAGRTGLDGTTQAMIEQFLYWTEAKKVLAVLLLGVPGSGKSWTAQCVAGEAKVPLLRGSMSTVKGSLVGESEQNMKKLLRTVDSVTQESTLMIATCNSIEDLTPEILARFKLGIFFYDYPTQTEQAALWDLYRAKYKITGECPEVENWVGREVESCCHRAWLFNVPLAEAAATVVPICQANAAKMQALRKSASGRFLSAASPGVFKITETTGRSLSL